MATENITTVDPHGFYSVSSAARILRISRATLYNRLGTVNRDEWGRIPGHAVLKLAGIDWRLADAMTPKTKVKKRTMEQIGALVRSAI